MEPKSTAAQTIEQHQGQLLELSHWIHANPELAFNEHGAVEQIRALVESAISTPVQTGVAGIPTAFSASVGSGELTIAICAEYDALPHIGHACGHNIIASAAVGAVIGLAKIADQIDATIRLIGTPAEERGGGKVALIEGDVFSGAHAAMMIHPAPEDYARFSPYASAVLDIEFLGEEAHASAAPEKGVNALDAMTIMMTAIGLARQGLESGQQIHGYIIEAGSAPNIIPGRARGSWMARAADLASLQEVVKIIERCAQAGATATGAEVRVEREDPQYANLVSDPLLTEAYVANASAISREAKDAMPAGGSTDMGNVSHYVPSIHPMVGLDVPTTVNLHTKEFAAAAGDVTGDRAVIDGARLLAWTAIDAASSPEIRQHLLSGSTRE